MIIGYLFDEITLKKMEDEENTEEKQYKSNNLYFKKV